MNFTKKLTSLLLSAAVALPVLTMTGCHGSRGLDPFVIPEEFVSSSFTLKILYLLSLRMSPASATLTASVITDMQATRRSDSKKADHSAR